MYIFLRDYLPARKRFTMEEVVPICYKAGWHDLESLAEAAATSMPESAGDPECFLAYYDLDQLALDAYHKRAPIRSEFRRDQWLRLRRYIIKQKIRKYPQRAPNSLTLFTVNTVQHDPFAADRGLFQISSYWYPKFTDKEAVNPQKNANFAHQIYLNWDKTFKAWAAHESGYHLRHMARARAVARQYLDSIESTTARAIAFNREDMPHLERLPLPANTFPTLAERNKIGR